MIIASGMTTARDFMHNSGARMGGGGGGGGKGRTQMRV